MIVSQCSYRYLLQSVENVYHDPIENIIDTLFDRTKITIMFMQWNYNSINISIYDDLIRYLYYIFKCLDFIAVILGR